MKTYIFQHQVTPKIDCPEHGKVQGAYATAFVVAESIDEARKGIGNYLSEYLWDIVNEVAAKEVIPDKVGQLDIPMHALYGKAQRQGIAVILDGWRGDNSPHIEIRSI